MVLCASSASSCQVRPEVTMPLTPDRDSPVEILHNVTWMWFHFKCFVFCCSLDSVFWVRLSYFPLLCLRTPPHVSGFVLYFLFLSFSCLEAIPPVFFSLFDPSDIKSVFFPFHSLSVHLQFIASLQACFAPRAFPFYRFVLGLVLVLVFGICCLSFWTLALSIKLALCFLTCLPWRFAFGAFLTTTEQPGLFEQDRKS